MPVLLLFFSVLIGFKVNADPTRPELGQLGAASSSLRQTSLILQGIIVSQQNQLAIISAQLLGVGGEINGYRVVSITPSRVVLVDVQTNEQRILSLRSDGINVKPW